MGVISVGAGFRLWREENLGAMLARIFLVCHGAVFLLLGGRYLLGKNVAVVSIIEMLVRTGVWIVINFMIRGKGQKGAV